ncbi:uncharacterized protein LOC141531448 [Cotesia typhae]|uniref:uncharacterized protein LOC141531448 n=1 Tax=Cotesia typhae TaxID=2053667 RepID=UPI003D68BDC4
MIKSLLNLKQGIDIGKFNKLKTFLKNQSKGFRAKKSVLTWNEINKFLETATDEIYLAEKVILIFGFSLNFNDVEDTGSHFIVSVRDTKNYYPRSFVIKDNFYPAVKKYIDLRPKNCTIESFFLRYEKGRCMRQVIGKNKICTISNSIATFLNLSNPSSYTGHCFRRTSTTLLANSGAGITTIKQHGGWRSSSVAEGYIAESLFNKKRIFDKIVNAEAIKPNDNNQSVTNTTQHNSKESIPAKVPRKILFAKTNNKSPKTLPSIEKDRFTDNSRNVNSQNILPSTSKSSSEVLCHQESLPLTHDDIENIENWDFDSSFDSLPSLNSNCKMTSCPKKVIFEGIVRNNKSTKSKTGIETETNSEELDALNLISPVVKIEKCTINHLTINYTK